MTNHKNHKKYIYPFHLFDCMLSADAPSDGEDFGKKHRNIVERAMDNYFGRSDVNFANAYIRDVFFAFATKKTQITLSLYAMNEFMSEHDGDYFHSLIMHPLREQALSEVSDDDERANYFKPIVFELFANLREIVLFTTDEGGDKVFAIDLLKMLA